MLNLFTAVIIESFEKTQRTEEWAVQPSAVEDFVETWADFDDGAVSQCLHVDVYIHLHAQNVHLTWKLQSRIV